MCSRSLQGFFQLRYFGGRNAFLRQSDAAISDAGTVPVMGRRVVFRPSRRWHRPTRHQVMTYQILAVGEVLWDLLPAGKQLGGAPANFAHHCRSLGADARLVTRVGDDDLGREVLERFRLLGLPLETVQIDPELPTGTVDVALAADGQPRFTIRENVAWDRIAAGDDLLAQAERSDAICFGSL